MPKPLGWGLIGSSTVARKSAIGASRAQAGNQVVAVMSSEGQPAGADGAHCLATALAVLESKRNGHRVAIPQP